MGGLGSASLVRDDGLAIGALAAVNAAGTVTIGETPHFWAAPFEISGEFGGLGLPASIQTAASEPVLKGLPGQNTTLAIVATDAALTKAELKRLAIMAQTGLVRAISPVHTPLDGDMVFALSTARRAAPKSVYEFAEIGALAANTLARAIARGVWEAGGVEGAANVPAYRDLFSAQA